MKQGSCCHPSFRLALPVHGRYAPMGCGVLESTRAVSKLVLNHSKKDTDRAGYSIGTVQWRCRETGKVYGKCPIISRSLSNGRQPSVSVKHGIPSGALRSGASPHRHLSSYPLRYDIVALVGRNSGGHAEATRSKRMNGIANRQALK